MLYRNWFLGPGSRNLLHTMPVQRSRGSSSAMHEREQHPVVAHVKVQVRQEREGALLLCPYILEPAFSKCAIQLIGEPTWLLPIRPKRGS